MTRIQPWLLVVVAACARSAPPCPAAPSAVASPPGEVREPAAAGGAGLRLADRRAGARPALLVVGTAHLANPGRDLANVAVDDVLAPERQTQIAAIVERLAAFRPTHIAVEMKAAAQDELDRRYRAYRAGTYALTRNEIDQLGLRLAATLGHQRVYAVDWNEAPPGAEADYDFVTYAAAHGKQPLFDAVVAAAQASAAAGQPATTSLLPWLRELNRPAALAASHAAYFDIARIGDAASNPGAAWVGSWYGRNLRIFANLVTLAARPDDRVLVIYGQGHAFLLREMATQSGGFDVLDAAAVLGD
jgi:hypothetical protein